MSQALGMMKIPVSWSVAKRSLSSPTSDIATTLALVSSTGTQRTLHIIEPVTAHPANTPDPVIEALDELVDALHRNIEANQTAMEQAQTIKNLRKRGLDYREIADETGSPLVVQLVTENLDRLRVHGARLRQAQAAALHTEGMTMDEIAELFGVTRQRISALLKEARPD